MRKTLSIFPILAALVVIGILWPLSLSTVLAQEATPTYDPLVEPTLPPNPTELELGQNLYWHWCMTCHGDLGQGLTDEWRSVWVDDHQNCWARGCHVGRPGDLGFPIPTVVPAIAGGEKLSHFAAFSDLYSYLRGTHPPQHPGLLEDKEYHAIAVYVFEMNQRVVEEVTPAPTASIAAAFTPTLPPVATIVSAPPAPAPAKTTTWVLVPIGLAFLGGLLLLVWIRSRQKT